MPLKDITVLRYKDKTTRTVICKTCGPVTLDNMFRCRYGLPYEAEIQIIPKEDWTKEILIAILCHMFFTCEHSGPWFDEDNFTEILDGQNLTEKQYKNILWGFLHIMEQQLSPASDYELRSEYIIKYLYE